MKKISFIIALAVVFSVGFPTPSHAAYSQATVREAQNIMRTYGIPTGEADGLQGEMTRRGLCIFRYMSGLTVNRNYLDTTTLSKLRSYRDKYSSVTKIPAPYTSSSRELLVAHETCQAMTISRKSSTSTNHKFWKVMAISTGTSNRECKKSDGTMGSCNTPNGTYSLGKTNKGWSCSTIYPETCRRQTTGQNLAYRSYGNMYNFRWFRSGGYGLHGSTSVPTYPASHGCVRVSVSNSDWLYNNVGNGSIVPTLILTGSYS